MLSALHITALSSSLPALRTRNRVVPQWVHFRSTPPKLYFPKIMKFSHYNEYGVIQLVASHMMIV